MFVESLILAAALLSPAALGTEKVPSTARPAFDSEEWLAKRDILACEAERLRAAHSNCLARAGSPSTDVKLPIETFPDGSVQTLLTAEKVAVFLKENLIWAAGVTVRKVDATGETVAELKAASCVIDRQTKSGWAEGGARVRQGQTEFGGEGVYFSSPEGYVSVFGGSRIFSKDLDLGGLK